MVLSLFECTALLSFLWGSDCCIDASVHGHRRWRCMLMSKKYKLEFTY
jgi:hypothetical protein